MKFLGDLDAKDLVLLDVKYAKDENYDDYAMLLLKNMVTGKKMVHNIKHPQMEIFFLKPEFRDANYSQIAISKDKLYSKIVPFRDVVKTIAKEAGGSWEKYYYDCIEQKKFRAIKNIFHYPYCFGADLDICEYYRALWNIYYYNAGAKIELKKTYLDIESDVIDFVGIPEIGTAPINAVSVVDETTKTAYFFGLRNAARPNPLIAKFEENIDEFYAACHDHFDDKFPGFRYQVYMVDTEVELLQAVFGLLKKLDPDMIGIWNMSYDVQSFIARARYLGLDPIGLFCDTRFSAPQLYYWEDKRAGKVIAKKDFFDVTSMAIWTDLLQNYGKLRKGGSEIRSLKLDYISRIELGDTKYKYRGSYDKELPYKNYFEFALYNIKDSLLLDGIEIKTDDFTNVITRALVNASPYRAVFSQTKFLKSRFYVECFKTGFIPGNNINIDYSVPFGKDDDDDEVKYDGAVVGDPELNEHVGIKIFGKRSKYVYKYVVDMDFSSFYPWTTISFNIAPNTMYGKLLIEDKYYHGNAKNIYEEDPNLKFECGKEFVENYITGDPIRLGMNWFGLPSIEQMLDDLNEKYPKHTPIIMENKGDYLEEVNVSVDE